MSDEARIKVGVEGEAEAERKLKKISDGFKGWGRELGGIVSGMVRNLGSMSMALAHVDPGSAAQKFRDYRRVVTEMSMSSGRSISDLKGQFASLSDHTLLPDEQVQDFSASLAKATYDFGDSRKAIEALRGSGIATGRSLEDMSGVAETLHNSMGVQMSDIPEMMGRIEASAKSMGTTGGPAALMDDLQALGGVLSQVSITGKRSAGDLVGVLAAIGKGRNPEQAKQVQAALVGSFTSGGEQMRLNLGIKRQDFYDPNGNVRVNAQNVQKLRDFYLRRAGGNVERAQSLASFSGNMGPQLAAAIFRPGLIADMKKASTEAAPGTGDKALTALRASEHGVETAKQNARDRETRENVGEKANAAQQAAANIMPQNSMARMFVTGIGGGIASSLTSAIVGKGLEKAAGGLAATLFKVSVQGDKASLVFSKLGALKGIGGAAAVAGAGMLGYEAGTYLDKKFGISTKIANALDYKSQAKEDAGVLANKAALMSRENAKQAKVKEFEAQGFSPGMALRYAEHPEEAPKAAKQPPVEVKLTIEDASGHPNQVVQQQKGSAGKQ